MLYSDSAGKTFEWVATAKDGKGAGLVVIRGEDGQCTALPDTAFPPSTSATYRVLDRSTAEIGEVIKELTQNIRHTSNLRFVAMPVFFATMGGISSAWIDGNYRLYFQLLDHTLSWAAVAGFLVALVFVVFDAVLSRNLIRLWAELRRLAARAGDWRSLLAHRGKDKDSSDRTLHVVRFVLSCPYVLCFGYWLMRLLPDGGAGTGAAIVATLVVIVVVQLYWRRAHS